MIINNWGHIITFWGRGSIGGDYHYLGARLLATFVKHIEGRNSLVNVPGIAGPGNAEKKV